ncbi:MAG: ABC transporter permease [Ignavibacteriales bacterium]|nr:ABC transporter permease [Ignavibacteriales bacterium]
MKIPLSYTFRSLWTRKLTTLMTVTGVALVVFVFAAVLMLAYGLEKTLVDTGYDDNVICTRKASQGELSSQIDRDAINQIKTYPEIKLSKEGKPLASAEMYTVINLHKIGSGDMSNVVVRGVAPEAFELRPNITMKEGRMFALGTNQIIVGTNINQRFDGTQIGESIEFAGDHWQIVGVMDAAGTGFDSEIWGDAERILSAFNRSNAYSSMTFRLNNKEDFEKLRDRVAKEPRYNYVELKRERVFYREQSEAMSMFITILGTVITVIFSIGAMIGAMITMYSSVANRTIEVGTLRALGFKRRNILSAFLIEAMMITFIGAGVGLALASTLQFFAISTMNFTSFSELSFGFALSPSIILNCIIFAIVMGLFGGFLPSIRAARMNIVNALRAS